MPHNIKDKKKLYLLKTIVMSKIKINRQKINEENFWVVLFVVVFSEKLNFQRLTFHLQVVQNGVS
jgi:preprotein translocase subunit SecB